FHPGGCYGLFEERQPVLHLPFQKSREPFSVAHCQRKRLEEHPRKLFALLRRPHFPRESPLLLAAAPGRQSPPELTLQPRAAFSQRVGQKLFLGTKEVKQHAWTRP